LGRRDLVGRWHGWREAIEPAHVHVALAPPERADDVAQTRGDQNAGAVDTKARMSGELTMLKSKCGLIRTPDRLTSSINGMQLPM